MPEMKMSLSIGERLKSARSAQGASLEEVAQATKVQRRILEAMEEDRVGEFLDAAYAKIFMKKYASYLGLDGTALVQEYLAISAPQQQEFPIEPQTALTHKTAVPPIAQVLVPAGLGLVGLLGLCFLGYLAMDLYGTLQDRSPQKQAPARKVVAPSAPRVEKMPVAPQLIVPRSTPLKLTIQTKADVWMQVKSDGSVIFQNVLAKGARETWIAKQELELWTGKAEAVDLSLNGKPLGSPGSGVRKGIKVTHEGLKQ